MAEWYDEMADAGEDYIHQSVRGEVVSQIHRLRKNTESIIKVNTTTTKWEVSYYSDEDKKKAESYFHQKGIKDDLVSYVRLNDMLLVKQAEFQFK